MKKIYYLFLSAFALMLALQGFSQSPRMAFIEEATQASCGPCAALNPGLQDMVNANPDNVVFLAYQVWWPGFDPMFLDNTEEVQARVGDYYGYGFAPQIVMQGSFVEGSGDPGSLGNLTQGQIDAINGEMSEFDIHLNAEVVNSTLNITGDVTGTADASGDLRLRLVIAEHVIQASDAPGGTNGETEYHHVFKKFVNGPGGITLAPSWTAGDTYAIDESFDLSTLNIYDYTQLEVIAFIQNDDNKFVHQAAVVEEVEITVDYSNNGGAVEVNGLPPGVCIGENTISPTITIRNNGNNDLTSVDIIYNINGGADQTFQWTGSLSTFEKEDVLVDPYTFTSTNDNLISVELANPNGMMDEDASDNTASASIGLSPDVGNEVTITLNFDCWAEENSWEIRNSAGDVVASNSYTAAQSQSEVVENYTLDPNDCHTFVFMDQYGDGMHGSQWTDCSVDGNITIVDQYGAQVYSYDGSYDITEEANTFSTGFVSSTDETALSGQVTLSPNPTSGELKVTLDQSIIGETTVQIFSLDGKLLQGEKVETSIVSLDLSSYQNGVYLVRLVNDEKAVTQRVTLQK